MLRAPARAAVPITLAFAYGCGGGEPARTADGVELGHPDSVLLWTPAEQAAGFPNYDLIFPTRQLPASSRPSPLTPSGADLAGALAEAGHAVERFLDDHDVRGVIVLQGDEILLERYADGHDAATPWVSYSIAKSVVSLLVGAALRDGVIRSLDEPVTRYLPVLEGSGYDGVRIRDALRMSSGVDWNEDYDDPDPDVSREIDYGADERLLFLGSKPSVAEPGTRFNYSTGEIYLVGSIVRAATGQSLSAYLQRRVWEPFGMEADANWMLVEPRGPEYAGCCISATLRDYARLGLFALRGGALPDGSSVLPPSWMEESTTPSPANPGYGYLWWLHEDGSYSARGIFGQLIHVDPRLGLVVAMHGIWPEPTSDVHSAARDAFVAAVKTEMRTVGMPQPAP